MLFIEFYCCEGGFGRARPKKGAKTDCPREEAQKTWNCARVALKVGADLCYNQTESGKDWEEGDVKRALAMALILLLAMAGGAAGMAERQPRVGVSCPYSAAGWAAAVAWSAEAAAAAFST